MKQALDRIKFSDWYVSSQISKYVLLSYYELYLEEISSQPTATLERIKF